MTILNSLNLDSTLDQKIFRILREHAYDSTHEAASWCRITPHEHYKYSAVVTMTVTKYPYFK
jgi:hypothetical protein